VPYKQNWREYEMGGADYFYRDEMQILTGV
jgi:hypothetical protein